MIKEVQNKQRLLRRQSDVGSTYEAKEKPTNDLDGPKEMTEQSTMNYEESTKTVEWRSASRNHKKQMLLLSVNGSNYFTESLAG